jgi:hypothetical protein
MSYKLQGKLEFQGLPISVENRVGSKRHWTDEDTGETGSTTMLYPYGYVRGTLGTDGDEVDVYIGPSKDSQKVYVITQNKKPEAGMAGIHPWVETDEQKVMLGFDSAAEAQNAYMEHYDDPRFFGIVVELTLPAFKDRLVTHHGKLIKRLNVGYQSAIMNEDNIHMLVLSKSVSAKAFQPQVLKPGSEEKNMSVNKAKMVDTEPDGEEEEAEKSLRANACAVLRKACASLSEEEMDLKKKKELKTEEETTEKSLSPLGISENLTKALRAITVAGMTRRERLDAAYQLGVSQGRHVPHTTQEPVQLTDLNIGTTRVRPQYEPPVVPVRHVEAPQAMTRPGADTASCTVHGYVHKSDNPCPICEQARGHEATPFWSR